MCGIWRTRSAYQMVFRIQARPTPTRAASSSHVALPPPPPVSPTVATPNKYETDFGLVPIEDFDHHDEQSSAITILSAQKNFVSLVRSARSEIVLALRPTHYDKKAHKSSIHGKMAIANFITIAESSKIPTILDLTNSLFMGLTTKSIHPEIALTMHATASTLSNKAVMDVIRTHGCDILATPLMNIEPVHLVRFTHIAADFIQTDLESIMHILSQFAAAATTGMIIACIMPMRRNSLVDMFDNLEFTYLPVLYVKNSDYLSSDDRTRLVRIKHKTSNNRPHAPRPSRKRSIVAAQTAPAVLQHCPEPQPLREPSPLTVDFSYENINPNFFQDQLEFLVGEQQPTESGDGIIPTAQLNEIAPFTESIPEDVPLNPTEDIELEETPPASPCVDEVEVEDEGNFYPDSPEAIVEDEGNFYPDSPDVDPVTPLCESPQSQSLDVLRQTYSPIVACQDDYADEDAIVILSDDEGEVEEVIKGVELDVAKIHRNLKNRHSAFKTFRETLPVCSSARFGGSCPTAGNQYIAAMADIICDYVRTHPGPYNFLDVRSRSIVGAQLETAFPSTVSFGHVAYCKEYLFSVNQTHSTIGTSIKAVESPLSEIKPDTFNNYQMIYVMAPWMEKDNNDLNRIILSFLNNEDTRVLWLQLKAEQYKNLRETHSRISINLRRAKMPGVEGSLYEIRK